VRRVCGSDGPANTKVPKPRSAARCSSTWTQWSTGPTTARSLSLGGRTHSARHDIDALAIQLASEQYTTISSSQVSQCSARCLQSSLDINYPGKKKLPGSKSTIKRV
jgi:hypothetical protein